MTGGNGQNRGDTLDQVDEKRPQARALEQLVEQAGDFVVTVDERGKVRYASDGIESVLGYDPAAVVDKPVETLLAGEESERGRIKATLLDGEQPPGKPIVLRTDDDSVVHADVSVAPLAAGDGIACLLRDVTEERDRNRERERYAELVETVGDPMYVLDADGTIKQVNGAMVEYTGYSEEKLVGRSITELVPSTEYDRVTRQLTEPDDDVGDLETFETTLVTRDGELVLSEANITVTRDEQGYVTGSVGVLRDIRERKRREQDLDLLKQVLTRVFRHNIRNELLIVQGQTDVVEGTVDTDVDEPLDEIRRSVGALLEYSEKARTIERVMESPEQTEFDLATEIEQAVATVEESYPESTVHVAEISEVQIRAHPKLSTAIEELLDNAIQHTPPEREPEVQLWTDEHDESVTVFVEDNAGGLDDGEIAVLREATESNLEHSSGVGLWLVRWIVDYSSAELLTHRTGDGTLMGLRFSTETESPAGRTTIQRSTNVRRPAALDRLYNEMVVGRLDELRELRRVYDELEQTGGHAVFVTGGPGVGKSTLVEEFLDDVADHEPEPLVARATCKPGVSPPYHVVGEALSSLPVETDVAAAATDDGVAGHDPDAVAERRQAVFAKVATELREIAATRPVIIVLEDLHWADRETVEFVEFLIDEVVRWAPPVLVVGTYRTTETAEKTPVTALLEDTDNADRQSILELGPLAPAHVGQILEQVLDVESVSEKFVGAVYEHTGGTPLFVTELAHHFVETLGSRPDPGELPTDFEDVAVPESVERAVTSRLDALLDPVVSVLELGAVVGETVSLDVLLAASPLPGSEVMEYANRLVVRHLWERDDDQYQFVHGVTRQKTLDRVNDDRRKQLHARVAEAIEEVYADTLDEQYGRLASHYEAADEPDLAFEYYHKAGKRASDAFAYQTALDHLETAADLAREHDCADEETFAEVLMLLSESYVPAGQFDEARETAREGVSVAPERSRLMCRLLSAQADALAQQGNYDEARSLVEQYHDLATDLGARDLAGQATQQLGSIAFRTSSLDDARRYHEEARATFQDLDMEYAEAKSRHHLALISHNQSQYDEAREHHESALILFDELGERRGKAQTLTSLGLIDQKLGETEQARERHEQSLELFREIGDTDGEAAALNNLGLIARDHAEYEKAREYYAESYELATSIGDRQTAAIAVDNLGVVVRRQGRYEEASDHHQKALDIYRGIDDSLGVAISHANLGKVALFQGEYDSARRHLRESLDIIQELGDRYREAIVRCRLGERARQTGNDSGANDHYKRARECAKEIENTEYVARSHCGLATVARRTGEYERAEKLLDKAGEHATASGSITARVEVVLERARLNRDWGDAERALSYLTDNEQRIEECGQPYYRGQFHHLLGDVAANPNRARRHHEEALDVFSDLDVSDEMLGTLVALIETCHETDEPELARTYCQQAKERLAGAPEPVVAKYCERVEQRCGSFDEPNP